METDTIFTDLAPEYKVIKKIGTGAYSSVWDAVNLSTGRRVAIKKETGVFEDPVDCKRLLREIKLLRCLQHPNVVRLIEVLIQPCSKIEDFDTIYLVLEIADTSLAKLIKSQIFLDHKQVKTIMYNILVGLNYVHSAGVLHRDLKPGNVLINKSCSVRICDFGLARSIVGLRRKPIVHPAPEKENSSSDSSSSDSSDNDGDTKMVEEKPKKRPVKERMSISAAVTQDVAAFAPTQAQTTPMDITPVEETKPGFARRLTSHVVTRWYRAPEIILMQENYGSPIDIWACGCIFAELLSTIKENAASMKERKPLFPGTSCLLLSPLKSGSSGRGSILSVASTDQLLVIIDALGQLAPDDLEFIKDQNVLDFIKTLPAHTKPADFTDKYPAAGKEALDLLKKMLTFNPAKRIKVEECLEHPYFTQFRIKSTETKAVAPVSFDFENEDELSEKMLRSLFVEELEYYRNKKLAGMKLI